MKGYKATDKDLKCRGFQFEIGKWYEHEGDLVECHSGFHFCEQPSGPWAYYSDPGTRIFEVEADDVLDVPFKPGADFKRVCRRIRLVREIEISGDGNTGSHNAGSRNTGNWNAGNRNTGDWNAGNGNTGNRNTGNRNIGDWNTGDWNIGDGNTGNGNIGDWNTGDWNTGDWNTGSGNTGNRNTGDLNTGNGNATDYSAGFFCVKEPWVISFDEQTVLTRGEYVARYPEYYALTVDLLSTQPINFAKYSRLPGITEEKLRVLHEKFIAARKKPEAVEGE